MMKKILTVVTLLQISLYIFAQVPQKMSYQAVVRNDKDSLLSNQRVNARISILQGSILGATVYMETQNVITNKNGLMTFEIGEGDIIYGSFEQIDWGDGPYYIKSEIDPRGSFDYSITSTQQLLSVPYALYSENAGNVINVNCPAVNICDLSNTIVNMQNTINILQNTVLAQSERIDSLQNIITGLNPPITTLPIVTTSSVSNITGSNAICGGNITYDGGTPITNRGVCWSLLPNPTLSNTYTNDGTGIGYFTSNITGLSPNTTYYVRAYATNSVGTTYGNQVVFTTSVANNFCVGDSIVMDIDGNIYSTVQIGSQCWMAENLRTTHYSNGTYIALGEIVTSDISNTVAYRYYPLGNSDNVSAYGYLYNWKALMGDFSSSNTNPSGVQGVCPNGWHIPSDAEWTQLTTYVGSQTIYQCNNNSTNIAKALASTIGWNSDINTCAVGNESINNNATGFTALPVGTANPGNYGSYSTFGRFSYFWSSTQLDNNRAYIRSLRWNYSIVNNSFSDKYIGISVRCIRN